MHSIEHPLLGPLNCRCQGDQVEDGQLPVTALLTLQVMCSIALLTDMMRMKWRRHLSARSSNSWEARSYRPETSCSRTTALLSGSSRSKSLATFAIIIESSCMLPITSLCSGGVCRNRGRKVRPSALVREANCSPGSVRGKAVCFILKCFKMVTVKQSSLFLMQTV